MSVSPKTWRAGMGLAALALFALVLWRPQPSPAPESAIRAARATRKVEAGPAPAPVMHFPYSDAAPEPEDPEAVDPELEDQRLEPAPLEEPDVVLPEDVEAVFHPPQWTETLSLPALDLVPPDPFVEPEIAVDPSRKPPSAEARRALARPEEQRP